jgi:hypothetical protein
VDQSKTSPKGLTQTHATATDNTIYADLCLGDLFYTGVSARLGGATCAFLVGQTVRWTVTFDVPNIAGIADDQNGPFLQTFHMPMVIQPDCRGKTATHYFKGLQPGIAIASACSTQLGCATAPGPTRISVDSVGPLTQVATDALTDTNPAKGGGIRVFAGRDSPGDTANRNTLRFQFVTSNPNGGVWLRGFDVADPSVNPMVLSGNDNRGTPQAGTLSSTFVRTDSTGTGTVDFTVTMQPGDNFVIAASCNGTYLNTLQANGLNLPAR